MSNEDMVALIKAFGGMGFTVLEIKPSGTTCVCIVSKDNYGGGSGYGPANGGYVQANGGGDSSPVYGGCCGGQG
jgi:hypothetical protein